MFFFFSNKSTENYIFFTKISMNVWTALVKTVARASIRTGDSAVRALLGGVEISATKVSEFWE